VASLCDRFYWAVDFGAVCAEAPRGRVYLDSRSTGPPNCCQGRRRCNHTTQDLALILARYSILTAPHSAIKDCPMCPCFYRYAVARRPDNQHNQSCQYQ
jgi:hypothetical protein